MQTMRPCKFLEWLAGLTNEEKSTITFNPDGTWVREDSHHMLVGAGDIWLEDKGGNTSHGKWNAGDGRLYMIWQDNSYNDYTYTVNGGELKLVTSKRGEVWNRN